MVFKGFISVISTAFSCIKGISSPTKLLRLRVNIYRVSKSHAIVPYVFCMTMITWVYQGQKGFLFWFAFKPSFLYTHGKLLSFVIKSEANFRRKNITKYVRHHVGYTSTYHMPPFYRELFIQVWIVWRWIQRQWWASFKAHLSELIAIARKAITYLHQYASQILFAPVWDILERKNFSFLKG